MDLGAVVTTAGFAGWVYDSQRDLIHVITSDGVLKDWSVADKQFVGSLTIGGTPGSIDVTPDGAYALIGNRTPIQVNGASFDQITRVNLSTHAIDQLQFSISGLEGGVSHLAITADNTALVTTDFGGSGWTPFRSFSATAANPTFSIVSGFSEVRQSSYLIVSDNRQHVLIQEPNISNGPVHVYDSATHAVPFHNDLYSLWTTGFNGGYGDYSEARGLALDVAGGKIFILDDHLQLAVDITSFQSSSGVLNGAFDTDGAHLFLWQGAAHKILVIDTQSWRQVGSMDVQTAASGNPFFQTWSGQMDVIAGGKVLALGFGTGVELLDLTQNLKVEAMGDATNEVVNGALGPDNLDGAGGSDTVNGGGGADSISGGAGHDILMGGAGSDLFMVRLGEAGTALSGLDVIMDWAPDERLAFANGVATNTNYLEIAAADYGSALAAANGLIGSGAADFVSAQVGADVVVFADSANNNGATDDAVVLAGRTLADIDFSNLVSGLPPPPVITGPTDGSDTLSGDVSGNVIDGQRGPDSLSGGGGADTLTGADGNDTVAGGPGADSMSGGVGFDVLILSDAPAGVNLALNGESLSGDSPSQSSGGDGPDTVVGFEGIVGSAFADTLSGGTSHLLLRGGDGADILQNVRGSATLFGGNGDDTVSSFGRGGAEVIDGEAGNDSISATLDAPGTQSVDGGAGDDVITGNAGLLRGDDGNDILTGVRGQGLSSFALTLEGGQGNDRLTATSNGAATTLDGGDGDDTITDTFLADVVSGGLGDDVITLNQGHDTVSGGGGGDTINARGLNDGGDVISGDAGIDQLSYGAATAGVFARLDGGTGGVDTISGVEILTGGTGDDTLIGSAGADTLQGGAGKDILRGLAGDDRLDGGAGADTASYQDASAGVTVSLAIPTAQAVGGGQGSDTLVSIENLAGGAFADALTGDSQANGLDGGDGADTLAGAAGADTLLGGAGGDSLSGGADADNLSGGDGADTLAGGGGEDSLYGGAGDDVLLWNQGAFWMDGGAGVDTISFEAAPSSVIAGLGASDDTPNHLAVVGSSSSVLPNIENLTGSAFNDLLIGDEFVNVLVGGGGDDSLAGLGGADVLTGGAGADSFVFDVGDSPTAAGQGDVITDFGPGDRLVFEDAATTADYAEANAATYTDARTLANGLIATGAANYVAVQVGADVVVFADSADDNGVADDAVVLLGKTLADIDAVMIVAPPAPAPPPPPPPPSGGGGGGGGFGGGGGGGGSPPVSFVPSAGADSLSASGLNLEVHAGAGDDTITGGDAPTYMRGDEGNDTITGGTAFDDINGNMGDDTASGGLGDDWVVGGKDQDSLSGDAGQDVVWGNLGADTLSGGDDGDQVRGGQGDDSVSGGAGNDYVSGDRGDDTISGGAGADLFHGSQDAGLDRVLDFHISEGDRVFLDPGTTYTVSQVGADTVISMGGAHQMVLVGVDLATLPAGWIFGA